MRPELFEPPVMTFGITNAPDDFRGYITNTIRETLDEVTSTNLDDDLIYRDPEEANKGHVLWIMQQLLVTGLYLKPETCDVSKDTVKYLGLIISTQGMYIDEEKVGTVRNCCRRKKSVNGRLYNLFQAQQFLGFWNYYQHFISEYYEEAAPLTRLTKQDEQFASASEQQPAFEKMVTAFMTAPVLQDFNHHREVIIETDAFNDVSAGVVTQYPEVEVLHLVAYIWK